jgi:hypothetical protein
MNTIARILNLALRGTWELAYEVWGVPLLGICIAAAVGLGALIAATLSGLGFYWILSVTLCRGEARFLAALGGVGFGYTMFEYFRLRLHEWVARLGQPRHDRSRPYSRTLEERNR